MTTSCPPNTSPYFWLTLPEAAAPCPECGAACGEVGVMQTCLGWLPFRDLSGKVHEHNPNRRTERFLCANGHSWGRPAPPPRCWCGWSPDDPVPVRRDDSTTYHPL